MQITPLIKLEEMSASVDGSLVSAAIVAYLGWGRGPHPGSDAQAVTDLAQRHGIPAFDLARAVEQAVATANTIRVDDAAHDAGPRLEARLRAVLPSLERDAVAALTSRAFWYARWDGGEPPAAHIAPHAERSADRHATTATPAPRQYWRHSTSLGTRYFALSDGRDFLLEGGEWVPYDRYRSGPSWWRLTGEIDADIVDRSELPPGTPD